MQVSQHLVLANSTCSASITAKGLTDNSYAVKIILKIYISKKQLGSRLDKRHTILGVNIISGIASVASVNGAEGSVGALSPSARVCPPKKIVRP